jgi:large subunit ribosomal protein L22
MQVRARLQDYRVGARKARLVADLVRGRGVEDALTTLEMCPKRVARPLAKLVRSAVANAQEKNERDKAGIDLDNLYIARIRARAQGRGAWINKRTSHIAVVLEER